MFESFHAEYYRRRKRKKIHRDRQRIFDFDQYRQNPYLQSLSIDPLSD